MSKLARDNRNRDLAAIHVAKKELMERGTFQSEEDYRAMLWTQARVDSSAKLDHAGRQKVLAYMRSLGAGAQRGGQARPVRKALTLRQRLMWSLWQQLADKGAVNERTMRGLVGYIHRQTSVARLEWLTRPQEAMVIESLKQWLERVKP